MSRSETSAPPPGALLFGTKRANTTFAGWRPGGTRDWLLIAGVSGRGRLVVAGEEERIVEGDEVLLYRPGAAQDYWTDQSWEVYWAHFTPPHEWMSLLELPLISSGVHLLKFRSAYNRRSALDALRRGLAISHRALRHREALAANALHEFFLWCDLENPQAKEPDSRVRQAVELLTRNLQDPFSLTDLAKSSGLSVSRLAQLFKEQMGVSPRQYWESHRLEHAAALLRRTQMTVAEVAEAVGFADPFYFSTRFKNRKGKSPARYRDAAG